MLYANTKCCWGSWERHQVCGAELYIWSQQLPPKYHPGDKLTGKSVTLLHIVSSSQHWQLRYRTGFVKISRSLVLRPTTDTFTFSFSSLHNSLISSWWIFAERSSESLKTLKSKREKNNLTVIQQLQKIEIQFVREFGFSPPKLINNGSLKVKGGVSGCKHVGEDGNTLGTMNAVTNSDLIRLFQWIIYTPDLRWKCPCGHQKLFSVEQRADAAHVAENKLYLILRPI